MNVLAWSLSHEDIFSSKHTMTAFITNGIFIDLSFWVNISLLLRASCILILQLQTLHNMHSIVNIFFHPLWSLPELFDIDTPSCNLKCRLVLFLLLYHYCLTKIEYEGRLLCCFYETSFSPLVHLKMYVFPVALVYVWSNLWYSFEMLLNIFMV